jgi:hypothetical protein
VHEVAENVQHAPTGESVSVNYTRMHANKFAVRARAAAAACTCDARRAAAAAVWLRVRALHVKRDYSYI